MPLLDIVGVDACQRTFCIAFAFLSGEEEGDFTWALQALRSVEIRSFTDQWLFRSIGGWM
ncbi:hypothetical protein BFJ63_vAg20311 [Fusarium oxysporum f. sp. narcissi]|uniref:MULE transposase domain-containing protein n=1 Tax=Fusarium oxysporum f. sp. narcissi TaxID=451672 RepID=A0A4Q2US95_FUSOX|nr:hypothetical protein BFJ63_vAg20311 [Fusarium oxysporum f. sp. narcissi]